MVTRLHIDGEPPRIVLGLFTCYHGYWIIWLIPILYRLVTPINTVVGASSYTYTRRIIFYNCSHLNHYRVAHCVFYARYLIQELTIYSYPISTSRPIPRVFSIRRDSWAFIIPKGRSTSRVPGGYTLYSWYKCLWFILVSHIHWSSELSMLIIASSVTRGTSLFI